MAQILLPDLSPGTTYNVQVRAKNSTGTSDWSPLFSFTTQGDTLAPSPVTSLSWTVVGTAFHGTWTAPTTNSDSSALKDFKDYKVVLTANSISVTQYTTATSFDLTFEQNKNMFGTPQATVQIQVYARDNSGNLSTVSTASATNPAPAQPANLVVTPINEGLVIKWDAVADTDVDHYEVNMSTTSGFTPSGANLVYSGLGTGVTIATAANYSTEFIKVCAVDVFGTKSTYASGSGTPTSSFVVDTTPPAQPTSLSATGAVDPKDPSGANIIATVTWSQTSVSDLAGFTIRYRKTGDTNWYTHDVNDGSLRAATISGLSPGTGYDFQIKSFDFSGNTAGFTATATMSSTTDTTAPASPTSVTLLTGLTSVVVSWAENTEVDVKNGAGTYEVQIATNSGFTTGVQTNKTTSTNATFMGLTSGTTYWARVRAVDSSGNASGYTNSTPASVTAGSPGTSDGSAPASSPTPSILSGIGSLYVFWTPVTNNDPVTYEVHISTTTGFTPSGATKVMEISGSLANIKQDASGTALAYGTTYFVKLIAKDRDGSAAAGSQASGTISKVGTTDVGNGAITATQISADTITANEIAANAITASELAANSVYTNALQANAVTAAKIAADTITANEIAANAITASELAAGSVVADKLTISAASYNLVTNPNFEDVSGGLPLAWVKDFFTTGSGATTGVASAISGANSLAIGVSGTNGTLAASAAFPVTAGETMALLAKFRSTSTTSQIYIRVYWGTNSSFTTSSGLLGTLANLPTSVTVSTLSGTAQTAPTLGQFNGISDFADAYAVPAANTTYQITGVVVVPTGATWARVSVGDWPGGSSRTTYFDDFVFQRIVSGVTIMDGTITGNKINVNDFYSKTGTVTNTLTIGASGVIQSSNYSAGSAGWQLSQSGLEINGGTIRAAALLLQQGENLMPAQYAGFEFNPAFYTPVFAVAAGFGGPTGTMTVSLDTANKKYESTSMKIVTSAGDKTGYNVFLYTPPASSTDYNIPVDPSTPYIISFWAMAPAAGNSVTPNLHFSVQRNSDGAFQNIPSSTSLPIDGVWRRYSGVYTTDATTSAIRLVAQLSNNAATVYVDGIQVEKQYTASTTPSPWRPPGVTSVDGGIVKTGSIQSTSLVTTGQSSGTQPAWSINLSGNAVFSNALVRGHLIVGDSSSSGLLTDQYIASANYSAGTAGYIIKGDGSIELNTGTFRGSLVAGSVSSSSITGSTITGSAMYGALLTSSFFQTNKNLITYNAEAEAADYASVANKSEGWTVNGAPTAGANTWFTSRGAVLTTTGLPSDLTTSQRIAFPAQTGAGGAGVYNMVSLVGYEHGYGYSSWAVIKSGTTLTMSFYARTTDATTKTWKATMAAVTSKPYTNPTIAGNDQFGTFNVTGSWQRFSWTFTATRDSTDTDVIIFFNDGTASNLEITGWVMEVGSTASTYRSLFFNNYDFARVTQYGELSFGGFQTTSTGNPSGAVFTRLGPDGYGWLKNNLTVGDMLYWTNWTTGASASYGRGSLFTPTHSTGTVTLSTTLSTFTTVHTAPSATYLSGRRYHLRFFGGFVKSSANGGTNAYDVRIMNGATILGIQTTGISTANSWAAAIAEADWVPGSNTTVALTVQVAQTVGTVTAASSFNNAGSGYYTLMAIDVGT